MKVFIANTNFSPAFLEAFPAFVGDLSPGDQAIAQMWFAVWTKAVSVAQEKYAALVVERGRCAKNGEWHGNNQDAGDFAECIRSMTI